MVNEVEVKCMVKEYLTREHKDVIWVLSAIGYTIFMIALIKYIMGW